MKSGKSLKVNRPSLRLASQANIGSRRIDTLAVCTNTQACPKYLIRTPSLGNSHSSLAGAEVVKKFLNSRDRSSLIENSRINSFIEPDFVLMEARVSSRRSENLIGNIRFSGDCSLGVLMKKARSLSA